MKNKAKFKKGDMFFHPTQRMFVQIDTVDHYPERGGYLYTLKCFEHKGDTPKPWKRYYESRLITELQPLKKSNAVKILYGEK
jgi:hypothetical protein